MKIKNENEKRESKTNIENENQNQESNLKMEIENENQDWNFDSVICWIRDNGLTLEAISTLVVYTYGDIKELKKCKADYKDALSLISKITNDNTIKDIVDDTLNGK